MPPVVVCGHDDDVVDANVVEKAVGGERLVESRRDVLFSSGSFSRSSIFLQSFLTLTTLCPFPFCLLSLSLLVRCLFIGTASCCSNQVRLDSSTLNLSAAQQIPAWFLSKALRSKSNAERVPSSRTEWRVPTLTAAKMSPHCSQKIAFGALSLDFVECYFRLGSTGFCCHFLFSCPPISLASRALLGIRVNTASPGRLIAYTYTHRCHEKHTDTFQLASFN